MDWYQKLSEHVRDSINLRETEIERMDDQDLRSLLKQSLAQHAATIPVALQRGDVIQQMIDELVGLGPLEKLLKETSVTEIMVNRHDQIFVEREGKLSLSTLRFSDEGAVRRIIDRIVSRVGRRVDESMPMADARLAGGERVNVVLPPVALYGPCITIRKFSQNIVTATELCRRGACTEQIADFLCLAVQQRLNILVCGGTGTGKTTLLNVLANWIPAGERVITVEDSAELKLNHKNLVALEARPPNQENQGAVSIRQLVINSLRMRPDRIVVGECRGGESLDMLQAMNTGHAGSLTTLHANTPRDALRRLEVMVMMAGMELPLQAIRQQISSAVDLVIQLSRLPDGVRIIDSVAEVQGLEGDVLRLASIFERSRSNSLTAQPNGELPQFFESLSESEHERALRLIQPPGEEAAYDS